MADRIWRIKACLNGQRDQAEHPAVPVTQAQLAGAALGAVAAGAEAVHLHPSGSDGRESLRAADIGAAVAAVRQRCPGIPVGVSTGLWITGGDPEARKAAVAGWGGLPASARPDFASVNLGEPGPGTRRTRRKRRPTGQGTTSRRGRRAARRTPMESRTTSSVRAGSRRTGRRHRHCHPRQPQVHRDAERERPLTEVAALRPR